MASIALPCVIKSVRSKNESEHFALLASFWASGINNYLFLIPDVSTTL